MADQPGPDHNGMPEDEQVKHIRREFIRKLTAIVESERPRAEHLKVVERFLAEEARRAEEEARKNPPRPWAEEAMKSLPFREPTSLPFPVSE